MTKKLKKPVKKGAKRLKPSMFYAMKGIFDAAGVKYRSWALRKAEGLQDYDGNCIVIGSSGGEPYTTFGFDTSGKLLDATCVQTSDEQQVAVQCVGKQTVTTITPFHDGKESRHVTNPEEN